MPIPLSNSLATFIRSLHRRKGRAEEGAYLVEGERLLTELAAHPVGIRFLFGVQDQLDRLQSLFTENLPMYLTGQGTRDLFATENAQGVGGVVSIPKEPSLQELADRNGPILYLDALADPGNVGSIIRTAAWFGIAGVLLSEGTADLYNPKTVRATMGALFTMQTISNVTAADLAAIDRPLIALDAGGMGRLGKAPLPQNGIYVVGNEAHGVSHQVREAAQLLAIPGTSNVESLNAAMAASILCYELFRQQLP